jgi:hypothetical protein
MEYISESGILLDSFWNEIRDESGSIIIIPKNQRQHYQVITKEQRGLY